MDTITLPTLSGVEHANVDLPGLRMHVAEAGAGEPVLLLHGFPQHWWEWRGIIPRLAPHYRVIVPDLRGAGWTDAPAEGYTRSQLLADLVALIDALGLDRVRLVAHDWSAIIGLQLSMSHPDRVQQYVGLASPHPWIRFRLSMLAGLWVLWFQPVIATPILGPRLLAGGNQRLARYLLGIIRPPLSETDLECFLAPLRDPARSRAGSALYRDLILPEMGRLARGAYADQRLSVPTLLLFGGADPVISAGLLAAFAADANGHADHLQVESVDGAKHFIVDDRPDVVADRILAFFGAS